MSPARNVESSAWSHGRCVNTAVPGTPCPHPTVRRSLSRWRQPLSPPCLGDDPRFRSVINSPKEYREAAAYDDLSGRWTLSSTPLGCEHRSPGLGSIPVLAEHPTQRPLKFLAHVLRTLLIDPIRWRFLDENRDFHDLRRPGLPWQRARRSPGPGRRLPSPDRRRIPLPMSSTT